jgi:hypothetical protein
MRRIFFILYMMPICICLFQYKAKAQALSVGTNVIDDYYRRAQLLGKVDSNISFTIRPIFPATASMPQDAYDPDSTLKKDHWVQAGPVTFANGLGSFQLLPLTWQQQFNSDHPYGWNDGAMIPAKGYQTMISGGFYFKFGPLRIQLRPEFVYAANPAFNGFATGHSDSELKNYYGYHNSFDWPERYGNGPYNKAFLGQSSISLVFGPMLAGVSNENIWWGPGIHNALILSNNAPGFKHVTLNTIRPIKTYIGSLEGQIIAGYLEYSGFPSLLTTTTSTGANLLRPKKTGDRYFTGFNINYHPKWISGLTLGLTRTFNSYRSDVKRFSDYIPFFIPYTKSTIISGDAIDRDQYTSMYARWLFPKAQAEVYFEYGLNDNSYNISDLSQTPEHSRAYVFGMRKMLPLSGKKDQHILVGAEITQLSQSIDRLTREAGGWYGHSGITLGHTNLGQILGAGTGSGGNLQNVDISWVSGLKKLGVSFERYEHNIDYYRLNFPDVNGNSRKWVDFAFALQGEWNYKNLLFNAKLQHIKSLNYQWVLKDYVAGQYYIPHNDVSNLHAELGVSFRF